MDSYDRKALSFFQICINLYHFHEIFDEILLINFYKTGIFGVKKFWPWFFKSGRHFGREKFEGAGNTVTHPYPLVVLVPPHIHTKIRSLLRIFDNPQSGSKKMAGKQNPRIISLMW